MKLLLLTGSHPRHLYLVNKLAQLGLVAAHIIETREEFVPKPPPGLDEIDQNNFIRHFKERELAESKFFKNNNKVNFSIPTLHVTKDTLNSKETQKWIVSQSVDLAISYGIHVLNEDTLNVMPQQSWNIHGGLSPWYKGNTTLFWPFYMLKPNWAGMTIHQLTKRLDGGGIIHHSVPKLEYNDGIHDVACKAVIQVAKDLCDILTTLDVEKIRPVVQKGNGKLWTSLDWTPQHLRVIYNTFNNNIVNEFLDGKLTSSEPQLISILRKE